MTTKKFRTGKAATKSFLLPSFDLARALCAKADPEVFFPDTGAMSDVKGAKRICNACEVQVDCLEWALKNEEEYGIWGGLTAAERRRLSRARKRYQVVQVPAPKVRK
jgi:WhiB family redox-sensing transcriptional regulator